MSYRPQVANVFDSSGQVRTISNLKIWTASVMSSARDGSWTADITHAGFDSVLCVQATAQSNTTSVNSVPIAVVRAYSATQVTGWVLTSNSGAIILGGMFGGLRFANTAVQVFVTVIGT